MMRLVLAWLLGSVASVGAWIVWYALGMLDLTKKLNSIGGNYASPTLSDHMNAIARAAPEIGLSVAIFIVPVFGILLWGVSTLSRVRPALRWPAFIAAGTAAANVPTAVSLFLGGEIVPVPAIIVLGAALGALSAWLCKPRTPRDADVAAAFGD
jgi:hypothetical protein